MNEDQSRDWTSQHMCGTQRQPFKAHSQTSGSSSGPESNKPSTIMPCNSLTESFCTGVSKLTMIAEKWDCPTSWRTPRRELMMQLGPLIHSAASTAVCAIDNYPNHFILREFLDPARCCEEQQARCSRKARTMWSSSPPCGVPSHGRSRAVLRTLIPRRF